MVPNGTSIFASGGANSSFGTYIFFGVFIVAVIAIGFIRRARGRKRTEAWKATAQEIGFAFEGDDWVDMKRAPLLETALFGRGRNGEFRNITTGSRDGLRVSLFDYSLTAGSGKGAHTETQTVGAFSKDGVYLPYFELRRSGAFDKVWDAVTHKNIHIESSPEFARHYVLRSPSENEVRSLLTPGVLSFFEQLDTQAKWSAEGAGNTLIIYHPMKRVEPAELRAFLDETSSIANSFFSLANCPADTYKR